MTSFYTEYLEQQVEASKLKQRLQIGDKVCFCSGYDIFHGTVKNINKKKVQIHRISGFYKEKDFTLPYEKVAKYGDPVVLVWEIWNKLKPQYSYRFERELYPLARKNVENIPQQSYLWEQEFKQSTAEQIKSYLELISSKLANKTLSFKF